MPTIRVFEPALCCNTGVCGPDVDQSLVTFTADLDAVRSQGVDIQRANLASDPALFAENPVVVSFLHAAGSAGLPLTLVDDVTVLTGRHPSREELLRFAGLDPVPATANPLPMASSGCCGGSSASSGSSCCSSSDSSTAGSSTAGSSTTNACC
ncbi:arsenite efflux transporter metallochaperone ArsD [Aestuariimicrobium sp. T2.26MG-19.2B]|uniref:arsenite efflux transporter metallochaperone ArsD n=1 Tax=Aestuariimicrobium sp. T2.26MG-19.2B TaxID=3040679 RepID=UPI002477B446|nr:arsenite efflux transporter metallochaperone ArsD [Aestuariimicrobium sp. T2.26MG-19.2B]CAI9405860.1 Arsenical resistance operon trans-acting repressor ArsD [Aestuariimicrobium sp. T2.26MG-19.2B]